MGWYSGVESVWVWGLRGLPRLGGVEVWGYRAWGSGCGV